MIERNILGDLLAWQARDSRKPLIIRGPRQVGKTTLVKDFGKRYRQFLYFNLEPFVDLDIFENDFGIHELVQSMFLARNANLGVSETLVFLDEIQESPRTIRRLRYFYEEYPDLHVIATGSLLDHALGAVGSFPVGRVEYLALHPFDFSEFLRALGQDEVLSIMKQIPVPAHSHNIILKLFHQFAMVGGMPEIVSAFAKSRDMTSFQYLYDALLEGYQNDIDKYASSRAEREILRHLMLVVPLHAEQRITFHNFAGSNYRSREVGEALRSLEKTRILSLIYPTSDTAIPAIPNRRKKPRLQYLDSGLSIHKMQSHREIIGLDDLNHATKGRIAQQIVAQNILASHSSISYQNLFWVRERKGDAEVDLVYPYQGNLIPIEIKSGASGRLRSLMEFMNRCDHGYAVRMYGGHFSIQKLKTTKGKSFTLLNLPYYLSGFLPDYLGYLTTAKI